MIDASHRWLSLVLLATGLVFVFAHPLMVLLPNAWSWEPRQHEYEQMLLGLYFVLGIFAVVVARAPLSHLSLVWFIAISNVVHGGIMLFQALRDPAEYANLRGDIPALIVSGLLIAWLTVAASREVAGAARPA